ncbi:MAG: sulfite exporter TauE/SafE family protein [Lachnospiraceae bacterium]|nr:sulfite exporter TauE/SafE family protein [Lachnospiraceae bacterium]
MLRECLIICPLVFIAGYIDAVAGGGGLVSLPAYMFTGLPIHQCVATNKMSSFMGTSVATVKYAKNRFIPWRIAFICIPCAIIGSAIGANIALMISDRILKLVMLIIVPITGLYVITRKGEFSSKKELSFVITAAASALISLVIGVYDGFYGPGTGTFLILLLTGLTGMDIKKANGLTKAINWSTNVSALTVFFLNAQVLIPLGLVAGLFNIAGNYLGAVGFQKKGEGIARLVMILVLLIFFVKLITELLL